MWQTYDLSDVVGASAQIPFNSIRFDFFLFFSVDFHTQWISATVYLFIYLIMVRLIVGCYFTFFVNFLVFFFSFSKLFFQPQDAKEIDFSFVTLC